MCIVRDVYGIGNEDGLRAGVGGDEAEEDVDIVAVEVVASVVPSRDTGAMALA